jgi:predicted transcriptional regulator
MKTTVEIPDSLLREVRRLASEQRTTVRAILEQALRRLVAERGARHRFRLRGASFRGNGLQPDVREGSWERIRDLVYEGRGA